VFKVIISIIFAADVLAASSFPACACKPSKFVSFSPDCLDNEGKPIPKDFSLDDHFEELRYANWLNRPPGGHKPSTPRIFPEPRNPLKKPDQSRPVKEKTKKTVDESCGCWEAIKKYFGFGSANSSVVSH
jgi:hypothetical protein